MTIVKLVSAKASGANLKIPTLPIDPPVRSPNPDDLRMRSEALVPSTLNLADIIIPNFEPLNPIMLICSKYNWDKPEDFINANYDAVAADLAALSWHILNCVNSESAIILAHANAESNEKAVADYHFNRIRQEANEVYSEQLVEYKAKLGPKPDKKTDGEIRAQVSVIMSTLGYPQLVNKLKSAKDQTTKIISRAENQINTLKKLMDRAARHGG